MKKFAVILSGCGVYDGSEIHEAVLTLLAIDKNKASYQAFAPDIQQFHVVDHYRGKPTDEKRNVLTESARIARGNIKALSEFNSKDYDALVIPGGFGCAKNLSDYAFKGADINVNKEVENAILSMIEADKPVGALCIAPVLLAKIINGVEITVGNDETTINNVEKLGALHTKTSNTDVIKDSKRKIFTTPCYMLDVSISKIAESTDSLIKEMLKYM
jgi:enhancing lycopene biosynthesis protein 2